MNLYKESKWCVYLNGWDDCLAVNSFEDAVAKQSAINKIILGDTDKEHCKTCVFAQIELWENVSDDIHEPNKVDWSQYGIKND